MDATMDAGLAESGADTRRPGVIGQLWRQRRVVLLTFCGTLALVVGLLLVLPVTYVATGSIIVGDREPLVASSSPAWAQKLGDPADLESNLLLIRSPRLSRLLLNEPGVTDALEADCRAVARQVLARLRPVDCGRLAAQPEAKLLWMQDRFAVGAVGRSRVISVSYKSPVPDVAQLMVNAAIKVFLDDERAKTLRSRDEAIDWVRSRQQQVDLELRQDEAAIETYRNAHGLVRGVRGPLASERLTQAAQQLSEAKAAEAEAALRMQEAAGGGGSRQVLDSRSIADLKQQLAAASAQTASAAQRLGAKNPTLMAYHRTEAELAGRLAAETARFTDAARRTLEAAHARVAAAQDELARRTAAASEAGEAETQIASMVRELEIKRGLFVDLSQRLSQLETERRILEPSTQLVNLAELPTRPGFPQRTPFLIGGLTLAAVLATTAGLVTYRPPPPSGAIALGRTFTRVPILAQIPELRLRRTGNKEVLARKRDFPMAAALALLDSHPPLLESIRILHARLALAGFGTRRRTLMVASEVAGEGKTFVTLALARLARASGRSVLVIESALRQPFLARAMNGPPSPGLSGYLMGGQVDVVQLPGVPGVDVIVAGEPTASSTELLSGPRLPELLEWAKRYDLVLVDSPAVSTLMDAALLAPQVEGVVFCLRTGRPPVTNGLNSLPEMQRSNGNVVGLALTFVPDEKLATHRMGFAPTMQLANPLAAGRA